MSLFAVIKTGGKQYLVKKGDILRIEKLEEKVGKKISFKEVLLCFDDKKRKVEIFGFKFRGFSELQETLGIFFKDKNIFKCYLLLYN